MGVGTELRNRVYLSTLSTMEGDPDFKAKIVQRVPRGTEGSITRKNKNGVEVTELHHSFIEGLLTDIQLKEHEEYGLAWVFVLEDNDIEYWLQAPVGRMSMGILCRLRNMDFSKFIKISIFKFTKDDVDKTYLTPYQKLAVGYKQIDLYYSKDNPGDLPPMELKKVKGKPTWDNSAQLDFFIKEVQTVILPKLREANPLSIASLRASGESVQSNPLLSPKPDKDTAEENPFVAEEKKEEKDGKEEDDGLPF
jgi:hypothetical protein